MERSPGRTTLIFSLFGGIFALSTAAIFIRFAQNGGAPSLVVAAARLTLATLFLAPYFFLHHRHEIKTLSIHNWILAVLSGIFLAVHFAIWITSLEYTSIASSVVLVTTTPLWVAIFSPILLKESMRGMAVLGLLLALIGSVIIGVSDSCLTLSGNFQCPPLQSLVLGKAFFGDMLALAGAWAAAGYMMVGRKLRTSLNLVPYIFIVYGIAAISLLILVVVRREPLTGYSPIVYLWFVLLAFIPQILGHSTFNWALKYLPASSVSTILLGEPIGSTVLAVIIFKEIPGWIKIGGIIFILVGIWMVSRKRRIT